MYSKSSNKAFPAPLEGAGLAGSAVQTSPSNKARSFEASKMPSPRLPPCRCLARATSEMPSFLRSPSERPLHLPGCERGGCSGALRPSTGEWHCTRVHGTNKRGVEMKP